MTESGRSGSKKSDPLLGMDPWAMGRSQAKGQTGINDEDAATRLCLLSTFVDSNGAKITQVLRWEVASSVGGVMFVSASNYAATLALTEHISPLIMILDRIDGTGLRAHEVTKTQLLVGTSEDCKVISVMVKSDPSEKTSVVHSAPLVDVKPSTYVPVTLKLLREGSEDSCCRDFTRKDLLSRFIGNSCC